jgi:hypothetical protein
VAGTFNPCDSDVLGAGDLRRRLLVASEQRQPTDRNLRGSLTQRGA